MLFSPSYGQVEPRELAQWILDERLPVRLQIQLHKVLWGNMPGKMMKRAVVLLSGGLDSATALAIAREQGYSCYALSVDYGQRHRAELDAAARVASALGAVEHRMLRIDLGGIGGSALTDSSIAVPESPQIGIPVTYVPARNTVMLAFALGWAEVLNAPRIFIGVNAVDYSGYPDCRPEFVAAFERVAQSRDQGGGGRHAEVRDRDAADRPDEGADHPPRHRARRGFFADGVLLPGRRAGPGLRPLRRLPAAARRLQGRRACRTRRDTCQ